MYNDKNTNWQTALDICNRAVACDDIAGKQPINEQNRADSIYDGRLGLLFFMLEIFRINKDGKLWNDIMSELDAIELYAQKYPAHNYTLFHGRTGIGFFCLKLFELTGEQRFLQKATAVAEEYYNSIAYRNGIVTKYGLFDGIAGVLLFTHELFLQTGYLWLLEHTEKYTIKILYNAMQAKTGLFWGGVTNRNKKNNGVAAGVAGIAYVLNRIGNTFNNSLLKDVARSAMDYEMYCIGEEEKQKHTSSFSHAASAGYGIPGIQVVNMYLNRGEPMIETPGDMNIPEEWMHVKTDKPVSYSMFSGLPGTGLVLLEMARLTENKYLRQQADRLAEELVDKYKTQNGSLNNTLDDVLGLGYFLLKIASPADDTGELFFLHNSKKHINSQNLPATSVFQPGNTGLQEMLLSSSYRQTVSCLKTSPLANDFRFFLSNMQKAGMDGFLAFVKNHLNALPDDAAKNDLLYHFEREQFVASVILRLRRDDVLTALELEEIDRILRLNTQEFNELKFVQSKRVHVYSNEMLDMENDRFDKAAFVNFIQGYGTKSYFYAVSGLDKLHVAPVGIVKFIYERFTSPITIKEAGAQIASFMCGQDEDVVELMKMTFGAKDDAGLRQLIIAFVIEIAGFVIAEGLLEHASAGTKQDHQHQEEQKTVAGSGNNPANGNTAELANAAYSAADMI